MSVNVSLSEDTKERFINGAKTLYNAVKSTMGPAGSTVVIEDIYGYPIVTKDGVTVAKSIKLKDPVSNMGVQLIKESSMKTNDKVGDGTTTATVLSMGIYDNYISKSKGALVIKREVLKGIEIALEKTVNYLTNLKEDITDLNDVYNIAMISSNGDTEISKLISEAVGKIGKDGTISINECPYMNNCSIDIMSGVEFKSGYISRYLTTNAEMTKCEFDNPLVMIINKPISYVDDIIPAMTIAINEKRPLFIIAHDIDGQALATMVHNKINNVIKVCGIKAIKSGDMRKDILDDLASILGTIVIDEVSGIKAKDITLDQLGTCDRLICEEDTTTFIGTIGSSDKVVQSRIQDIKSKLNEVGTDLYKKEYLESRLTRLSGGVAILNIGGSTESEIREKRDRIDDTIHAIEAALDSGVLIGGGYSLLGAYNHLTDIFKELESDMTESNKIGFNSFMDALCLPNEVIRDNAQLSPLTKVNGKFEFDGIHGIDILKSVTVNLRESGIIDPYKVTISALNCAASISKVLISTKCLITSDEDTDKKDNTDILNKIN